MSSGIFLSPGSCVGNYRVLRMIGQGGMGTVYEVEHVQIHRRAAMKLLTLNVGQSPLIYQRFVNEARAANQIRHPGVVQVFEFGQLDSGVPWMMMDFVPGVPLDRRLSQVGESEARLLTHWETVTILHQLATILVAAHEMGILHRDLKPQNVMLSPDPAVAIGERVRLLDFGIAKLLGDTLQADGSGSPLATGSGALLGTPAYMAPEQCRSSSDIDGKADVYAVGVMAFQMLCGRLPFWDTRPMQLIVTKLADEPPALRSITKDIPSDIEALVMSMLAREAQQRPSMAEVESRLATFAENLPKTRSGTGKKAPDSSPRVTEALTPPLLSTVGDIPSLPIEPQALASTPSRMWMSAEQVPASSPPPIPNVPSIGQIHTHPAPFHVGWPPRKALWLVPIMSLVLAAGLLSRSTGRKLAAGTGVHSQRQPTQDLDLGILPDLREALDLSVASDLSGPLLNVASDLSSPLDVTAQVSTKKTDNCHKPTLACFADNGLTAHDREVVLSGLQRASVKLCRDERLLLRFTDRVSIRLAPLSIGKEAREELVVTMSALRPEIGYRGDVIVQCGK